MFLLLIFVIVMVMTLIMVIMLCEVIMMVMVMMLLIVRRGIGINEVIVLLEWILFRIVKAITLTGLRRKVRVVCILDSSNAWNGL
jgi:hypothetical protein